jgi:hypothetical protein
MAAQTLSLNPETLLNKDLQAAASTLSRDEARYIVDAYYRWQEDRKREENQVRALSTSGEPHAVIAWLGSNSRKLEDQIRKALDIYSSASPLGVWAKSLVGVGPVIAAGLLAHIDLEPWRCTLNKLDPKTKACTAKEPHTNPSNVCGRQRLESVGHIWRFAGLDPTVTWGKGEKRPWNAALKLICWKLGESFTKTCNHDEAYYGRVYTARKRLEESRNDERKFSDQAKASLEKKNYGKTTDAYAAYIDGKLPQARIHLRAQRYAVKLFLSHYHWVAYELAYGVKPPKPFVIEHLGHTDLISPPNWKGV